MSSTHYVTPPGRYKYFAHNIQLIVGVDSVRNYYCIVLDDWRTEQYIFVIYIYTGISNPIPAKHNDFPTEWPMIMVGQDDLRVRSAILLVD
jgi:hypothetical protein